MQPSDAACRLSTLNHFLNVPQGQEGVQFQPDADDEPTDEGRLEHDLSVDGVEWRA